MRKFASKSGFGLLQVMVGAVVLGIFAMVFVRKAQNRADVSLLAELITYRDQVLDYYAAVVQSRTAWQCTRRCNSPPTTTEVGFVLYDGDGNCQSGCPTAGITPTKRLPRQGWRFSMRSNSSAFVPPAWERPATPTQTASTIADTHPFHVKAEWKRASSTTNSVKVTISIEFSPSDEWRKINTTLDIGGRQRVFYMNRTPYKNCADGLAARFGSHRFFDDGGSGAGVARYAGDTAVVAVDAVTGLVKCWNSPLVIPPCYRYNQPPFDRASSTDSANTLDFVANRRCYSTDKGLCPKVGSGTTGITHFDNFTGISHCGTEHILMVERSGVSGIDCGATRNGGLVGISASGDFICSNDSGVGGGTGVEHNEPSAGCSYGIQGWDASGNVICANNDWVSGHWYWRNGRLRNSGYREREKDRGNNIAFDDGYWVGDKGEKGCKGDNIRSCNCCEYPQHCTDATWTSLPLSWRCRGNRKTCRFRSSSTLKNDFKGCENRDCDRAHGCLSLDRCITECNNCNARRYSQDSSCRRYRNCISACDSACYNCKYRVECKSERDSYDSCSCSSESDALDSCRNGGGSCDYENDRYNECTGRCRDKYDTWSDCVSNECGSDCVSCKGGCGSQPTCNLEDCRSKCNTTQNADYVDYVSGPNECNNKAFANSFFGTSTISATCSACKRYNRRCARAESDSKKFKTSESRPALVTNPATGCSGDIYTYPSARTSCP